VGVLDLFHKREERAQRAGKPDVYQYEDLPPALRRQIAMIAQATMGPWGSVTSMGEVTWKGQNHAAWEALDEALRREFGVFQLTKDRCPDERVLNFLLTAPPKQALSVIEVIFRVIDRSRQSLRGWRLHEGYAHPQDPNDAIEELNHRFREHGVGYQYVSGSIIRLDDDFTHGEVIRPALALLAGKEFSAADSYFRAAHRHYREGEGSQAMGEALKALESTLKAIFDQRSWPYASNATAKPLLDIAFAQGLLPTSQLSYMAGVRAQLESGLPTTANPNRHGQPTPSVPPDYLVRFALQQAASSITLLVEAHRALGRKK
jgi:hypothetical protein